MSHGYGGGGMMGLGWFFMILFWGAVVVVAFLAVRWILMQNRGAGTETPLDVLKRRYAAGEISKEEYERMRRELEA